MKQMMNDTWKVVEHSWSETGIYSTKNNQRICLLNLEDWDVNEDNQDEFEKVQLQNASLISSAPELLKLVKEIQENCTNGIVQMSNDMEKMMKKVLKANEDNV
jgi:Mg2+ and Co2+ transporter CorA